jgi:hypothetical protein
MSFLDNVNFLDPTVPSFPGEDFGQATHPESKSAAQDIQSRYHYSAKYRMYDLSVEDEVLELEELVSSIMRGEKILRQEKWTHDKEGKTVVTMSWLDLIPKKKTRDKMKMSENFEGPFESPDDAAADDPAADAPPS